MQIDRRTLMASSASALALGACGKPASPKKEGRSSTSYQDLTAQIQGLKRGEIKASELVEATIERIERLNPKTHALLTKCYDRGREHLKTLKADSLAVGAPMLIKDLKDVAGVRTSYGMGAFKNFVPQASSPYVERVEQAGFTILGKTNTPELGLLPVTEPLAYGAAKNPWDLSRTTGGSSGGTAAAVSSGMLPCAQGSDGGGSIRIPSHYCGLFGLKPSRGRVIKIPQRAFPIAVSGALSKTVRDNALMLSITENSPDSRPFPSIGLVKAPINRKLKIGFAMRDYFQGKNICNSAVTSALEKTAQLCKDLGHEIEVARPPVMGQELIDAFLQLWASVPFEVVKMVKKLKGGTITDADVEPWTQIMAAGFVTNGGEVALAKAVEKLKLAEKQVVAFLQNYDVVLSPVMPTPAHKLGKYKTADRDAYEEGIQTAAQSVGYTAVHNVSGAPCMSVPLYRSESGLPIGSQFIAHPGRDDLLLQLAYQLEAAQPWLEHYPKL